MSDEPTRPSLLDGVTVLVVGGAPAVRAGRVLADLGADVVRVAPHDDPLRRRRNDFVAWCAGSRVLTGDAATAAQLAASAHVVLATPHDRAAIQLGRDDAPDAVWVDITPFGTDGPRSGWRATDLGVMAASGNMYSTGYADRAPIRATEPTSEAHVAGEAAFAAIAGLFSGRPQYADVSVQECVLVASMSAAGRFARGGPRGQRGGANIGRTREIWPTADGFVSFGIRGGKARQASMQLITKLVSDAGIDTTALQQDWTTWSQVTAPDDELAAMESAIGAYFATRTMGELYAIAVETNLMLAPANSPREVYASEQLAARDFFATVGNQPGVPRQFVVVHGAAPAGPRDLAIETDHATFTGVAPTPRRRTASRAAVFDGVNILEFGSGAAGPIANRYFAEHGATVLRIESSSRPDFLRAMAIGPHNPHGLEGSDMYDSLNCGKRNLTLNLKHPDAVAIVRRLVTEWADAVAENYAPRAMKGFGLDYTALSQIKPDLVMISACLNGQTGPHKDYPGFGGQGSALSGWNWITGWPDREPVGPYGTITDSLAPRYVAAALAAGLLHRQRTGRGCYLDVAQVETGLYALSPWLLDYATDGVVGMRDGNRNRFAVPHGAFPCADEVVDGVTHTDRWVAVACHDDAEWARLAAVIGVDDPSLATFADRSDRVDEIEAAIAAYTTTRTRAEVAATLQALDIEAVPVADFGDVVADPQIAHRHHFIELDHPFMGPGLYERNGIRYSDATTGYTRPGPTLGQDNAWVLGEVLGLDASEIERLAAAGALD